MKPIRLLTCAVVLGAASAVYAQSTTQTVNFDVQPIAVLAMTGSPTLTINTATAGSAPTNATASTTYAITSNQAARKITASIDTNMPANITLSANLTSPGGGGVSAGAKALSTTAQDVVTTLGAVSASGINLTYTLAATIAAAPASGSRTVTYTIVAGP